MHNLAVSYASGAGGKKNMAEAARWFAKAAALGLADSQFNLAVLYERGDGVPQSLLDAYKWYSIAAAAGDAESKQRMNVLADPAQRSRPRRGRQVGRHVPCRAAQPRRQCAARTGGPGLACATANLSRICRAFYVDRHRLRAHGRCATRG